MPARTRLAKQALIFFAVLFSAFIVARATNDSETPSYELTNSVDLTAGEIATNSQLIGQKLPDLALTSTNGETVLISNLFGKPMIVNVWYSTCEPCRREMPVLASAADQYLNKVRFVGINIKDSANVAKEFAGTYGVKFDLLLDTNGQFITTLGIATAPMTLAVSAQGQVIGQVAGEISAEKLDELVKELLK